MGFPRQEYWSGLSFPSAGDLPDPGIKPTFLVSPALASDFFTTVPPRKLFTVSDIYFDHLGREIYCFCFVFYFYFFYQRVFITLQYCIGFAYINR